MEKLTRKKLLIDTTAILSTIFILNSFDVFDWHDNSNVENFKDMAFNKINILKKSFNENIILQSDFVVISGNKSIFMRYDEETMRVPIVLFKNCDNKFSKEYIHALEKFTPSVQMSKENNMMIVKNHILYKKLSHVESKAEIPENMVFDIAKVYIELYMDYFSKEFNYYSHYFNMKKDVI